MDTARRDILEKLKKASLLKSSPAKPDFSKNTYHPLKRELSAVFIQNLELLNGEVHIFKTEKELFYGIKKLINKNNWEQICCREEKLREQLITAQVPILKCKNLPKNIEVGITSCEYLVAHTGSVMVSTALGSGRELFVYPPIHIIIAKEHQIVDYLGTAYNKIMEKYGESLPSMISNITGPSRTADIEKTLVLGAHGPKALFVYISK